MEVAVAVDVDMEEVSRPSVNLHSDKTPAKQVGLALSWAQHLQDTTTAGTG